MLTEIVLVNWKRANDTCACISSIQNSADSNWYLVVCDNFSQDGSAEIFKNFLGATFEPRCRHTDDSVEVVDYFEKGNYQNKLLVTLVINSENSGFSRGNNIALKYSSPLIKADYFWFLNNDTVVEPCALNHMLTRMNGNSNIGICGSTLVYDFDRLTIQAYGGAEYQKWTGAVREIGNRTQLGFPSDQQSVEKRMSYVSGASMLVSKEFLETVGPLSEDYFLYYEEIDWAIRARKKGFRLGYASDAIVYHKEGAALGSGKSEGRSLLAEYYGVRNRLVFTRKFYPWALPSVFCFSLLQVLRRCLQGRWGHARLMAAVLFGLRKVPPR